MHPVSANMREAIHREVICASREDDSDYNQHMLFFSQRDVDIAGFTSACIQFLYGNI